MDEESKYFVVEHDAEVIILKTDIGQPGHGIPSGGDTGEILIKNSNTDYDFTWLDTNAYTLRADYIDDYVMYRGDALPGGDESLPIWKISKLVLDGNGDITVLYANGDASFNYIWNNRLTYTYS